MAKRSRVNGIQSNNSKFYRGVLHGWKNHGIPVAAAVSVNFTELFFHRKETFVTPLVAAP